MYIHPCIHHFESRAYNVVTSPTKLKDIRLGLSPKVSQEYVARKSDVTLQTYNKAENGKSVTVDTANSILRGINEVLQEHGLEPVSLDDLMLHLY